jgi:hypothetical protein
MSREGSLNPDENVGTPGNPTEGLMLALGTDSSRQAPTPPAPAFNSSPPVKVNNSPTRSSGEGTLGDFGHGRTIYRISVARCEPNVWVADPGFPSVYIEMMPARTSTFSGKGQDVPGAGASGLTESSKTALVKLSVPNNRSIYQNLGTLETRLELVGAFLGFDNGDLKQDNGYTRTLNAWSEYMDVKDILRTGREIMIDLVFVDGGTIKFQRTPGSVNYRGYVNDFSIEYATSQRIYYKLIVEVTNREDLKLTTPSKDLGRNIPAPSSPLAGAIESVLNQVSANIAAGNGVANGGGNPTEGTGSTGAGNPSPSPTPSQNPSATPTPNPTATPTPAATPKPQPTASPTEQRFQAGWEQRHTNQQLNQQFAGALHTGTSPGIVNSIGISALQSILKQMSDAEKNGLTSELTSLGRRDYQTAKANLTNALKQKMNEEAAKRSGVNRDSVEFRGTRPTPPPGARR